MAVNNPVFLGDTYTTTQNNISPSALFGRTSGGVWLPTLVNSTGALLTDSGGDVLPTTNRFTRATINITTAATTAVVSATASQTTKVYRMMLNFAAPQTLNIASAATSLVGAPMTFGAGGSLVLDFIEDIWFVTVANEALNFITTTTGTITGFVDYVKSA